MSLLSSEQQNQISDLLSHRDKIVSSLYDIEQILKKYFPEEFDIAYQHWIPQITTALFEDTKWLKRGQYSMQQSIERILDKEQDIKHTSCTKKYI
jgi:hypothetical protein